MDNSTPSTTQRALNVKIAAGCFQTWILFWFAATSRYEQKLISIEGGNLIKHRQSDPCVT